VKNKQKTSHERVALSAWSYIPLALTIGGGLTCSFYAFFLAGGAKTGDWGAWIILLGGLALTASVALGIAAGLQTTRQIEQIVLKRTRDLRKSETRYRTITENTSDWIWETDADGAYTACAGNVKTTLGYEAHELVGRNALDMIPAEEQKRIQPHLNRAVTAKAPFHNLEHWVNTRDGGRIYVSSDGVPILNEEENLRGYHGVTRDITRRKIAEDEARQYRDRLEDLVTERTESLRQTNQYLQQEIADRRKAEATLREKEQQLRDIADRVPGIVYQFYARPNGEYGFHYLSEGAAALFGFDHEEEDPFKQFLRHVHQDDVERFTASIADAIRDRKPWEFRGRFVPPSGETLWFRVMSAPEERAHEVVFNGLILDVTDVRQAEESIREKERLLNATLESTADGIEVTDHNGNLIHFNTRFAEMWGIPESVLRSDDDTLLADHMKKRIREVERQYVSPETGLDTLQFSDGRILER
jgi:PAS domain S-box-containing protein